MDFTLANEEKALVEALSHILGHVCSTQRVRAWEADQVSFDDAFLAAVVDGGFLEAGLSFGDCPSFAALVQLEEVAGRFLAPPLLSWLSGYSVFLLGDHPLARSIVGGEIVAPVAPGRARVSLAGSALDGEAGGVPFLDRSRFVFISLSPDERTDGVGVRSAILGLVDREKVQAALVTTQSLVPQWRVTFDRAEAELVEASAERQAAALARLRTCLAAWSTGAASQALELASAYAREREQFDHPIGSYQSVQNRLVDAAIQVEQGRMLAYRAASLIDAEDGAAGDLAVLARHHAGRAFVHASRAALQTFGGYGFTVDFDAQLFFRRAKEAQLSFEPRPDWRLPPAFRN